MTQIVKFSDDHEFYVRVDSQEELDEFRDWLESNAPDARYARCERMNAWNVFGVDIADMVQKVHFKLRWSDNFTKCPSGRTYTLRNNIELHDPTRGPNIWAVDEPFANRLAASVANAIAAIEYAEQGFAERRREIDEARKGGEG